MDFFQSLLGFALTDIGPPVEFKPEELRVPCKPGDIIAADHHMHRCEACDVTWKHPDSIRRAADASQFHVAHLCPSCGDHITDKLD